MFVEGRLGLVGCLGREWEDEEEGEEEEEESRSEGGLEEWFDHR